MTWLVFVVFVPVIGGICYIISGRGKALKSIKEVVMKFRYSLPGHHGRIYLANRLRANERHIR